MQMCQTVDSWVQVEDSKVVEMIYVMWKVKLKLNLSEIQGKYMELAEIVKIVKISISK